MEPESTQSSPRGSSSSSSSIPSSSPPPAAPSRFSVASPTDPASFISGFDLLHELAENREEYMLDEVQLSCHRFPGSLLMLIDQARELVPRYDSSGKTISVPGRNPTIVCCLSYGLRILTQNPDVKAILQLRRKLNVIGSAENEKNKDAMLVQTIWNVFESFSATVGDNAFTFTRRQGIHLGQRLKQAIFAFKSEMALKLDSFVILCVQISMYDQEFVVGDRRLEMRRNVDEFFKYVGIWRRLLERLIEEIEQ